MNFYEFLDLDDRGKAFAVWHYGVYLLSRTVDDLTYKLYAIEDFYVEISHSKDDKLVEAMNSFESVEFLSPYLDLIELEELETIVRGA